MIYTSNFSRCGTDSRAVSIALKSPDWYKGREYKRLAPPYWLLEDYHKNKDVESYSLYYYSDVLSRLNPCEIIHELGYNVILLCWESPGDFCHRHLVSEWLNKELDLGIEEYIEGGFF